MVGFFPLGKGKFSNLKKKTNTFSFQAPKADGKCSGLVTKRLKYRSCDWRGQRLEKDSSTVNKLRIKLLRAASQEHNMKSWIAACWGIRRNQSPGLCLESSPRAGRETPRGHICTTKQNSLQWHIPPLNPHGFKEWVVAPKLPTGSCCRTSLTPELQRIGLWAKDQSTGTKDQSNIFTTGWPNFCASVQALALLDHLAQR